MPHHRAWHLYPSCDVCRTKHSIYNLSFSSLCLLPLSPFFVSFIFLLSLYPSSFSFLSILHLSPFSVSFIFLLYLYPSSFSFICIFHLSPLSVSFIFLLSLYPSPFSSLYILPLSIFLSLINLYPLYINSVLVNVAIFLYIGSDFSKYPDPVCSKLKKSIIFASFSSKIISLAKKKNWPNVRWEFFCWFYHLKIAKRPFYHSTLFMRRVVSPIQTFLYPATGSRVWNSSVKG